jgi:type VI secretion system protein ImpA
LVDECLAALAGMSNAFDTVAGAEAPPVSGLRDLLEQVNTSIRYFAADKLAAAAIDAPSAVEEEVAGPADGNGGAGEGAAAAVRRVDGYASRNEALTELTRLATYFRKTEPHSPISYTLEDAVRRARMSLPELLAELAEDPAHAQRILLAAGIRNLESAE